MCNTSNRGGWLGSEWRGVVSGRVGGAFASKGGREGGCGRRRDVREGWSACYIGSSLVERAHNLLNGVFLFLTVWKPRSQSQSVVFINQRDFYQGNRDSLISKDNCVRGVFARGERM